MSTAQLETQDTGLALLPEQETWVAALHAGARREAIAHCLRVDIHGELDVPRLQQALDKAQRWLGQRPPAPGAPSEADFLLIHDRGRTERVPLNDIVYLKAELKYVTVRTPQRSHIFDGSLHELEQAHGPRVLLSGLALLGLLLVLIVPWRSSVELPTMLEAGRASALHAPTAARVNNVRWVRASRFSNSISWPRADSSPRIGLPAARANSVSNHASPEPGGVGCV